MKIAASKTSDRPQSAPATNGANPGDTAALLRKTLIAFWETGSQDEALREQIMALPNEAAALTRGEQIRAAFRPFAGTGISVQEFLREKHAGARRDLVDPEHSYAVGAGCFLHARARQI